jgi:arginine exporter protein ArgO
MTLLNPLSLVAWLGLALALPASIRTPVALVSFGIGIVAASAVWHTGLAAASGSLAPRLGHGPRTVITRCSGLLMLVIGGVLVA